MIIKHFDFENVQYVNVPVTELPIDAQLPAARAQRLFEINQACERTVEQLTSTYPPSEVSTFTKQETEAHNFSNGGPTPLLNAIASRRSVTVETLVGRVLEKSAAFSAASGDAFGLRQALEDQLDNAQTLADVEAVLWD